MADARRDLLWIQVIDAARAAGVKEEALAALDHDRHSMDMIHSFAEMLIGGADRAAAENYVELTLVGVPLPFDRVALQLVRPGGKTPHELRRIAEARAGALRDALRAAREPIAIAASYVAEPGIAIGLRTHAEDCAAQLAKIDAALAEAAA